MNIPLEDDDYAVNVRLKDESTFAYSPRRFAYNEKLQIREITDDLSSITRPVLTRALRRVRGRGVSGRAGMTSRGKGEGPI